MQPFSAYPIPQINKLRAATETVVQEQTQIVTIDLANGTAELTFPAGFQIKL